MYVLWYFYKCLVPLFVVRLDHQPKTLFNCYSSHIISYNSFTMSLIHSYLYNVLYHKYTVISRYIHILIYMFNLIIAIASTVRGTIHSLFRTSCAVLYDAQNSKSWSSSSITHAMIIKLLIKQ